MQQAETAQWKSWESSINNSPWGIQPRQLRNCLHHHCSDRKHRLSKHSVVVSFSHPTWLLIYRQPNSSEPEREEETPASPSMEKGTLHRVLQTGNSYRNKADTRDLPMGTERRVKPVASFGISDYPPLFSSLSPRLSPPVKDPIDNK